MSRPVKSQIVRDAGWTHDEYERRDALIMRAAMQVFPTKDSWQIGKGDKQKSAELDTAMRLVVDQFITLTKNDWYKHSERNSQKGKDYNDGLCAACIRWARGELSYRSTRFAGWWDSDGKKRGIPQDRPTRIKLRIGSLNNDSEVAITAAPIKDGDSIVEITPPLPSPPRSSDGPDDNIVSQRLLVGEMIKSSSPSAYQPASELQDLGMAISYSHTVDNINEPQQSPPPQISASAAVSSRTDNSEPKHPTQIDWAELAIEIDATSMKRGTLWILMQSLMPEDQTNPGWRDFEYQRFLEELLYVNDGQQVEKGKHELVYMDGARRHPIRNMHDYAIMLKLFSRSRHSSEETLKLILEHNSNVPQFVKEEPVVIDMSKFAESAQRIDNTGMRSEQPASRGRIARVGKATLTIAHGQEATSDSTHSEVAANRSSTPQGRILAGGESPALPLRSDVVDSEEISDIDHHQRSSTRERKPTAKRRALDEDNLHEAEAEDVEKEQHVEQKRGKKLKTGHRLQLSRIKKPGTGSRKRSAVSGRPVPDYRFVS